MKRKIAIPTKSNQVDSHFGHCEYYTIFSLDADNKVSNKENLEALKGCGCKSDIAGILKEMNVDTLLAGNMGQGALNKLSSTGIKVIRGCSGDVNDVIKDYIKGKINDSGLTCSAHTHHDHEHGHQCSH